MSRYVSASEAVDIGLLGNADYLKRDRLRLLSWGKYVWQDMNFSTLKIARREYLKIDKRTNSVNLPCTYLQLSSVNVVDHCGIIYPVFRNDNVKHSDLVEIGETKNCGCEHKCGYKLCNTIKGYEICRHTETDELPNGDPVSFDCIDKKCVLGNYFYEEKQYPQRVYEDGVWTDTILHTEQIKLCEVEVDHNGCVCDSETNIENVCNSCGINNVDTTQCCIGGTAMCPPKSDCETWIYYCDNKMDWFGLQCGGFPFGRREYNNVYNISELGNRLIFPHNFGWDKVLVRFYEDTTLPNLQIPVIAIDTFIMGLKWWDCRFNDKKQPLAAIYARQYAILKFGLLKELNKYRIQELKMITSAPAYVPSTVHDRSANYGAIYTYSP